MREEGGASAPGTSSRHARTQSGGSAVAGGGGGGGGNGAGATTMSTAATTTNTPLSRNHSLLADFLDASGVHALPPSEVHMNAPVPTREHVGECLGEGNRALEKNRTKCYCVSFNGG